MNAFLDSACMYICCTVSVRTSHGEICQDHTFPSGEWRQSWTRQKAHYYGKRIPGRGKIYGNAFYEEKIGGLTEGQEELNGNQGMIILICSHSKSELY